MSHGDRGGSVVKVLCCQSKGRWFDPYLSVFIIIIIIIIIFIYCNWVVTRWQWLFYMYTEHEIGCY